jgi:hypothetical protein
MQQEQLKKNISPVHSKNPKPFKQKMIALLKEQKQDSNRNYSMGFGI